MRIGFGWDLHRLVQGRRLVLGGVEIPCSLGEDGHSDGDVLIHAVIDALFGACALGDIGMHFPPEDPAYKNISSRILLNKAVTQIRGMGFSPVNIDCTIVLEEPRLRPYIDSIRGELASDLGIPADCVSVKAKTKEGVDATGTGMAVEAFATVLLESGPNA